MVRSETDPRRIGLGCDKTAASARMDEGTSGGIFMDLSYGNICRKKRQKKGRPWPHTIPMACTLIRSAPGYIRAIIFSCQPLTRREPHRSIAFTGRNSCSRAPEERPLMSLRDFITKQFIDVIEWVEPEEGILAYRYPMQDREIQNGGKLTVRDSQAAVFVNEGKVADIFGPGLYTLNTQTLPILTYLKNWDKAFKSPFKSDVYFFSARIQTDQHWATQ